MKKIVALFFVLNSFLLFSQDLNMQVGTFNQCAGTFYDPGGTTGNYSSNEDIIITICPDVVGDLIRLDFSLFNTEDGVDIMTIFNGDDETAPPFGDFTGTTSPNTVQATQDNTTGCLTIQFVSNGSVSLSGWAAEISCVTTCQVINSQIDTANPMPNGDGYIRVCPNEDITLTGSGTFSDDGTGATYQWDLGDGNTIDGQTATFSYPDPGVYLVNLNIRDTNTDIDPLGCQNNNLINQVIQVSNEPDFSGTESVQAQICIGESTTITGQVVGVLQPDSCTPPFDNNVDLPDGNGAEYQTPTNVDCFDSSAVLTDASQILSICINMEHSYVGDLDITIISPSGLEADLFQSSLAFGESVGESNGADDGVPGVGSDYCFSNGAAVPLTQAPIITAGTPPVDTFQPGTYLPVESFNNLIGSPLNGTWTILVRDNFFQDDGTIFSWDIEFEPSIVPAELSFTPIIVTESWDTDPSITNTTGNTITVEPTTLGQHCYTYRAVNDFGCEYTEEVCIDVVDLDNPSFTVTPACGGGTAMITGDTGGTFALNPVPTDGAVINPTTGEVTGGGSATTYTVEYTTAGVCPQTSTQNLTTLVSDVDPSFTIAPTCDGGTVNITGDTGGVFAFDPIPTDGAIIDTATGEVTNGISGTTYTVEYTTSGTCILSSTEDVTVITADDASFTLTPTCDGGAATINGAAGGTFSFNPIPTDGAVIDAATGEVTGGSFGAMYTIEYTTSGTCPTASTENLTVLTQDDASFTVTAICDGGTVTITGDAGGTFVFNPVPTDGAVIDSTTGEVTNGTSATTYTIEYTTAGACPDSSTQDVTVLTADDPSFTVTPTCDGGTVTITGDTGGTFALNPVPTDGAVIDASTGEVTGGTSATTYTIEYTTAGTCPQTLTQNVTVITADDASFTITPTCDGGVATITGGLMGGTFAFNPIPTDGAVIDTSTGEVTGGTSGTTYTIEYTTSGICVESSTQDVTVITADDSSFTVTPTCDGGTVTITGDTGGTFALNPVPTDGTVIDASTGEVTGGTFGTTYTIEYSTSGICPTVNTEDLTVLTLDDSSFTVTPTCDGGTVTITGDAGGTFVFNPVPTDGAVIDSTTGEVTNGMSATTYTIEYTTAGACPDSSTQDVTVLTADDPSFTVAPTCDGGTVTITGDTGGIFALNPVPTDGAVIDASTGEVTGGTSATTYTIEYTTAGTCPQTLTQNVTVITADDASFTVTPTCDGGVATITGLMGGTFAFNPIPTDGAVIDTATGEVTGGTPGVAYSIEYSLSDICPNSAIVEFNANPLPDASVVVTDFLECENNTDFLFDFDFENKDAEILNGQDPTIFTVTYHETEQDADDLTNPIVGPYENMSNPQLIFVAITNNVTGCTVSTQSFDIEVLDGAFALNDFYEECDVVGDNNGSTQFDLDSRIPNIIGSQDLADVSVSFHASEDDAMNDEEPLPLLYENLTNPQIIYARVSSNIRPEECFDVAEVTLQTNLLPIFNLDESYTLCLSSNAEAVVPIPPVIDTGLPDADYTFEWSLDGTVLPAQTGSSIIPTQGGTYSVLVTDTSTSTVTMCTNFDETEVIEGGIPDTFDVDVTSQAFTGNNMIIATATGNSEYEFSLDDGPWQLSGEFENVSGGDHVVAVRDVLGCGILFRNVTIIDYPKFFTPNGDGTNDTWNIKGINSQPTAVIYIHDRYGKLLKQLSPTSSGWDGTYNGNIMPSSDYWFTLEYQEPTNNEQRTFTAHFALKR